MSGPKIAALYGLIPNELGLCGPKEDQEKLRQFIRGELNIPSIVGVLKKFQAAYQYYELIARVNRISAGPLNKRVVEAYWLGNELLEKITVDDMRKLIVDRFSGPGLLAKNIAIKKAVQIPENSKPHHSFHVLVLGAITGSVDFTGNTKLKDICRVGWGRVNRKSQMANGKAKIIVDCQPLVGDKKIEFGKVIKKELVWDSEILPEAEVGNWVSFHWNHAIQILNEDNVVNLYKYTKNTLDSFR